MDIKNTWKPDFDQDQFLRISKSPEQRGTFYHIHKKSKLEQGLKTTYYPHTALYRIVT